LCSRREHFASGLITVQQRPLVPVRLRGPAGWSQPLGCILSSGSDLTIFPEEEAGLVGIDLQAAPTEQALTDTGLALLFRRAGVPIRIADGSGETCEWDTTVAFTTFPLIWPLLGHTAFLEFFHVGLDGELREAVLSPNRSFQGLHTPPPGTP
jgi:hypothetical protein